MIGINERQIQKITELFKKFPEGGNGLNFYSYQKDGKEIVETDKFPPLSHPKAVNFLFFVVMHDFGFWYGNDKGYYAPLYGKIAGVTLKGSDVLWKACLKAFKEDETRFEPARLAIIKPEELAGILSDDNGLILWPDFEVRFRLTTAFGRWFDEMGFSADTIIGSVNSKREVLFSFLSVVRNIPGYDRDPFEKKNMLLAMALANRPEKFLKVNDPDRWLPLVDYHLMRLALRSGMVEIHDRETLKKNRAREWVDFDIERRVRYATYGAVSDVIEKSGRPMSFVDEKMWMARRYCPEMELPKCEKCIFGSVCKKRIDLFQPVYRTTAY